MDYSENMEARVSWLRKQLRDKESAYERKLAERDAYIEGLEKVIDGWEAMHE